MLIITVPISQVFWQKLNEGKKHGAWPTINIQLVLAVNMSEVPLNIPIASFYKYFFEGPV